MKNYTVYYLVKEIVSLEVNAISEQEAKDKSIKLLNAEKRKGIECLMVVQNLLD